MRAILSLSIPPKKLASLKKRAKNNRMTISAYVMRVINEEEHLMSEEELLQDIRIGEKEYREGKCAVLRSDKDIDAFFKRLR